MFLRVLSRDNSADWAPFMRLRANMVQNDQSVVAENGRSVEGDERDRSQGSAEAPTQLPSARTTTDAALYVVGAGRRRVVHRLPSALFVIQEGELSAHFAHRLACADDRLWRLQPATGDCEHCVND
jgi:hypothetical protein